MKPEESMARSAKSRPQSDETWNEAMRIARGTQRPGQTKEQTRLIAKGIQNGIEQYKKRQSAKARELDRNRKKVKQQIKSPETREIVVEEKLIYRQSRLPWILLVLSWLLFAVYWLVTEAW
jgi:sucrose-6-phosphate hydrolase SacC (GH32 family)